jgi:hypothetical protein
MGFFMPKKYMVLLCLSLFSCSNNEKKDAAAMKIEPTKMVQLLADIHLVEAALEVEPQGIRDSLTQLYYPQVLARHQVSKADFDSTMHYLGRHPVELDSLYRKMNVRLDTLIKQKQPK